MHLVTFHHCSGKVSTVVRIPALTWFPTWICFCVSLMRLYIQFLGNYTAANCVRVMWESKETEQRRASKHAVIRRAEQISCTTWIEINLYLIYIWVPLLIWWGRRWMEAPVLRPNTVSPLMNSKRGRGNSAGGEPGPSEHTRLLVTCLQFTFISTQCGLKRDECCFPVCSANDQRLPPTEDAVRGSQPLSTYSFPRPKLLYWSEVKSYEQLKPDLSAVPYAAGLVSVSWRCFPSHAYHAATRWHHDLDDWEPSSTHNIITDDLPIKSVKHFPSQAARHRNKILSNKQWLLYSRLKQRKHPIFTSWSDEQEAVLKGTVHPKTKTESLASSIVGKTSLELLSESVF